MEKGNWRMEKMKNGRRKIKIEKPGIYEIYLDVVEIEEEIRVFNINIPF